MTFKRAVFYIVILILVLIVGYSVVHKAPTTVLTPPDPSNTSGQATPAPVISTANYSCDNGATIVASYTSNSAALTLSDGRQLTLPQTVSADGAQYASGNILFVTKGANAFLQENGATTFNNCLAGNPTTTDANGMKTFTDQGKTFTLNYPAAFTLAGGDVAYTQDWKTNTDATLGLILMTLTTPTDYMPKTNLGDVKFHVGTSSDTKAISSCLTDNSGIGGTKSTVTINGIKYTKIVTVDAGAGNRYETDSYRTVQNKQCYAIEYTVHYVEISNYDPSMGIKSYDSTKVHADFDGIVQSLHFLPQS